MPLFIHIMLWLEDENKNSTMISENVCVLNDGDHVESIDCLRNCEFFFLFQ